MNKIICTIDGELNRKAAKHLEQQDEKHSFTGRFEMGGAVNNEDQHKDRRMSIAYYSIDSERSTVLV